MRVPDVSIELYFESSTQLADTLARAWSELHDQVGGLALPLGDAAAIEDILRTYRPYRDAVADQANSAKADGRSTFTLEIDLPTSAPDDVAYITRLLARIEQLCAEHGIELPATAEIRAFRLGLFAAIAAQLDRPS